MRSNQPPAGAIWLLRHLGCSPNNDVVIGDLDERYRHGRSRMWYWRQAAAAIVVSFFKEVWTHKLLTIRAIAVGWTIFVVFQHALNVTRDLLFALESWSKLWRHGWITLALQIPEAILWAILTGWLIARLHHRSRKAMVLVYAAFFTGIQIVWITYAILYHRPLAVYGIFFMTITVVAILVGGGVFGNPGNGDRSESNCAAVS